MSRSYYENEEAAFIDRSRGTFKFGKWPDKPEPYTDDSSIKTTTIMLLTFEPLSRYSSGILKFRYYNLDDATNITELSTNLWRMSKRSMKTNPIEQNAVRYINY